MIRWVPTIKFNGFKKTNFGVGVKHDILQWIPSAEKLPISLSVIGTYAESNLALDGELLSPAEGVANPAPADYESQSIEYDNSAWSIGLIMSKKLPVLTVFGGVQLSNSKTALSLRGPYPVVTLNTTSAQKEIANLINPVKIESKNNQFGINGGLRIKMGIMHITVAGTYAPSGYSSVFLAWGIGYFN